MKKYLSHIEIGILLYVILFDPFLGKLLALFSVITIEAIKHIRGADCYIKRNLTGKVAVITGGNTGIGKETALQLARQGCQVVIGARDTKKSIAAVEEIISESNNKKILQFSLDLGSRKSIDEFVQEIKSRYQKVDYLINNAGVMMVPDRRTTADGFEMQMGTNHIGHFYLTSQLWELIKNTPDLRVVNVSSLAHKGFMGPKAIIDFENINLQHGYGAQIAYQNSKLANVLFAQQLAVRLQKINSSARSVSLHPGVVNTELSRYMTEGKEWLVKLATPLMLIFMKNPKEGAQTTLYTVLGGSDEIKNGEYYADCALSKKNPFAYNPENQQKLWKKTEELLGITFEAN